MSDAVILAADTALGACSVAVLRGETVLAHRLVAMERGHAEALAPMAEAVMAEAGLAFSAIDRLAVTTGPGTFTGQRVGLAFMRGLRLALNRPLTGITSLAAMAAAAQAETGLVAAAAIHDARRGEVYLQAMGLGEALAVPQILPLAEALDALAAAPAPLALAGTAAAMAAQAVPAAAITQITAPDARFVARLAQALPPAGDVPRPLYLRAPDAKLPGAQR